MTVPWAKHQNKEKKKQVLVIEADLFIQVE